jgi:RimJ/RimL family protein N-acetyltransferase
VYAKYAKLYAHADPQNSASSRLLEKAGFIKGEYMKEAYERALDPGIKRDFQAYYINRPEK